MTELFIADNLYAAIIDRVTPVAGRGDVDQVRLALGPLLADRGGLAKHLADLKPAAWSSATSPSRDDVVIALSEVGDVWPRSIAADLIVAELEARAMRN